MLSDKEKQELLKKSEARMKSRGAPFHGMTEPEILALRSVVNELRETLNHQQKALVELGERLKRSIETIGEQKFQSSALLNLCRSKGVFSVPEFNDELSKVQFLAFGLEGVDEPLGQGLVGVLAVKMFDGEKRVDEQTKNFITYDIGSEIFPFEKSLVGMKTGEKDSFSLVWPECKSYKNLVGRNIQVLIEVKNVCRKR